MKLFKSWLDTLWRVAAARGAAKVLAVVSFIESIFFPIPPDLLLIPMALAERKKAFRLAGVCLVSSILGGIVGYFMGYYFMDWIGDPIVGFYGLEEKAERIKELYKQWDAWVVSIAGLTPIPYKVCTLTAGAAKINFFVFIIASTISRGIRFFTVAGLIYLFGDKVRGFLEKRFDLVLVLATVLVVLGFVMIKYIK